MRKIFYAAILILFCAIDAHAQNAAFGDTVFGPNIAIKPGAFVTICSHPSTVASCPANKITLYSDVGGSPVTNPLTTDGNGHWLAYAPSGTYDYIVTGTGITPMTTPFTFSIGGSGSGPTLQTNGTPNSSQSLLNLHAGTNITLANVAGTTTINATGGGTGCTLPGNVRAVLSENPAGTCYDSAHFTWNDDATRHFLIVGDGTNSISTNAQSRSQLVSEEGTGNTLTSDTNVVDNNIDHIFLRGDSNTAAITDVGVLGTNVFNLTAMGNSNHFIAATGGTMSEAMALMRTGTFTVNTQGQIDDSLLIGLNNSATSAGAGSVTSSLYAIGEGNQTTSGSDGQCQDNYDFGEVIHIVCGSSANSEVIASTNVGFHITNNSSSGHTLGNLFQMGETISSTSSSGNVNDVTLVGDHLSMTDCNNYYAFGKNISCSGTTGRVDIGLSSTAEQQITSGLVTLNATQAVLIANAGSTGTTINKLAKLTGAPSTAVITATSDTRGAIGIVSLGAGTTGSASVSNYGIALCVFDGATTAGDYVNISSSTAGDCHDAGALQPSYSVGRVMSTNGGGGTYSVNLGIGSSNISNQGQVSSTGLVANVSPTALITTPASPALAAYRVTAALSCDASSASATVTFTLAWTDPSNTSQSITSSAATCTTLGSASYQSLTYAINVKASTAINYSTTIANTPTYSLHVLLEGAW